MPLAEIIKRTREKIRTKAMLNKLKGSERSIDLPRMARCVV
jgi:hypothetical protein